MSLGRNASPKGVTLLSPITKYVTWQNSIQKVCRHSSAKKCSPHFEPARSSLARKMDSATTSACRPADRGAARRQGHESSPRPRQRMCASPAEAQVGAAAAAAPVDAQGGATVTRPAPLSARSTLAAGCGVAPNAERLMEPADPREAPKHPQTPPRNPGSRPTAWKWPRYHH